MKMKIDAHNRTNNELGYYYRTIESKTQQCTILWARTEGGNGAVVFAVVPFYAQEFKSGTAL